MTDMDLIGAAICMSLGGAVSMGESVSPGEPAGVAAARAHRASNGAAIITEFSEFLSLPNVARDAERLRRNAMWIVAAFARRGIELESLSLHGAAPVVIGHWDVGAATTIGVYAHYDGQPVTPERWSSPPWAPTLRTGAIEAGGVVRALPAPGEDIDPEWRMYARSAADDKAPIMAVLAAIDALRAAQLEPSCNLVFLFEGQEEIGSPDLAGYMERHRERLQADVWLVGDGPVHQSRAPQIIFGVRGVSGMEITVYGAGTHLHSGHYGNWAPNPAMLLVELLASMKDERGRVTVAGFYDDVQPLSATEHAALARVPDYDVQLMRELGIGRAGMEGLDLAEALQLPSLNIRGFVSGGVGSETRNMIPATATASLDVRLVKGNDPKRMLDLIAAHVRAQGYHVLTADPTEADRLEHPRLARIERDAGYPAARASMDLPIVPGLVAAARAAAGVDDVILVPTLGGSLPLYLFESALGAPAVIVPLANHDNNQHGPDENLRIANLWYGVDLWAGILTVETGS